MGLGTVLEEAPAKLELLSKAGPQSLRIRQIRIPSQLSHRKLIRKPDLITSAV